MTHYRKDRFRSPRSRSRSQVPIVVRQLRSRSRSSPDVVRVVRAAIPILDVLVNALKVAQAGQLYQTNYAYAVLQKWDRVVSHDVILASIELNYAADNTRAVSDTLLLMGCLNWSKIDFKLQDHINRIMPLLQATDHRLVYATLRLLSSLHESLRELTDPSLQTEISLGILGIVTKPQWLQLQKDDYDSMLAFVWLYEDQSPIICYLKLLSSLSEIALWRIKLQEDGHLGMVLQTILYLVKRSDCGTAKAMLAGRYLAHIIDEFLQSSIPFSEGELDLHLWELTPRIFFCLESCCYRINLELESGESQSLDHDWHTNPIRVHTEWVQGWLIELNQTIPILCSFIDHCVGNGLALPPDLESSLSQLIKKLEDYPRSADLGNNWSDTKKVRRELKSVALPRLKKLAEDVKKIEDADKESPEMSNNEGQSDSALVEAANSSKLVLSENANNLKDSSDRANSEGQSNIAIDEITSDSNAVSP
ncbi:hypothetical protein M422DRAFT_241441 [Sphaerobolus stellatus SS14]|nr:hypothetical protein M422DRAFT_241441 [Sphaerobolus stellatus SS14]